MSSDFVRYSPEVETFDPKLSEYMTRRRTGNPAGRPRNSRGKESLRGALAGVERPPLHQPLNETKEA
jgi:hypothetical protein